MRRLINFAVDYNQIINFLKDYNRLKDQNKKK